MSDKFCKICNKKLWRYNKSGYCSDHMNHMTQNLWKNKEYRDKIIKGTSKPRREEFKKEQSRRIKEWFKNNPAQKQIRSNRMKQSWRDGSIIKNGYSCNESYIEVEFFEELKKLYPFCKRKDTIKINSKWYFPDIIIIDQKIIIEFFGDFWHANPKYYLSNDIIFDGLCAFSIWEKDKNRIMELESCGYQVLIIWESDYKEDPSGTLKDIENYLNWESCCF